MPLYLLECTRHIAFPSRRRQNPLRPLGCAARPPCESCLLAAHRIPDRSRTSQKSTKLGYLASFPRCCDAPVRQLPLLGQPKQQRCHSVIRVPQGQLHKGVDSARWPRCVQRRRRKKEDLLPSLLRRQISQKNIVGRRRTGIMVGAPQNTLDGTTTRWRRKMGKKTVRATSVRRLRTMPKKMHSVYLSACQAMICNDPPSLLPPPKKK
ncbi:casein kinase, putative, partial [Trypanosoma cruzi]